MAFVHQSVLLRLFVFVKVFRGPFRGETMVKKQTQMNTADRDFFADRSGSMSEVDYFSSFIQRKDRGFNDDDVSIG